MLALALSPASILQLTDNLKLGVLGSIWYNYSNGSLAQLARAPRLHRGGQEFEPLATHQKIKKEPRALYLFSDMLQRGENMTPLDVFPSYDTNVAKLENPKIRLIQVVLK